MPFSDVRARRPQALSLVPDRQLLHRTSLPVRTGRALEWQDSKFLQSRTSFSPGRFYHNQKNSPCSFLIALSASSSRTTNVKITAAAPCETSAMLTSSMVEEFFDANPVEALSPSPTSPITA